MSNILKFLDGKKTYIIAIVVGLTAAAQSLGYTIPDWVYGIEGMLGIVSARAAIAKVS